MEPVYDDSRVVTGQNVWHIFKHQRSFVTSYDPSVVKDRDFIELLTLEKSQDFGFLLLR